MLKLRNRDSRFSKQLAHMMGGDLVVGQHFSASGSSTQIVEAGFMANAWMRVRHEDYDTLRSILDDIGRTIQVRAH